MTRVSDDLELAQAPRRALLAVVATLRQVLCVKG